MSGKFIISSKIINTKHQMFWNKEKANPTLGNRLCEAESLADSQPHRLI